jgi:hypothetical protein
MQPTEMRAVIDIDRQTAALPWAIPQSARLRRTLDPHRLVVSPLSR